MADIENLENSSQTESPETGEKKLSRRDFLKLVALTFSGWLAARQTGRFFGQKEAEEYKEENSEDVISNYFDVKTREQYKENDIVPLYSPERIDSSTYKDSLYMPEDDPKMKYVIAENAQIGHLGTLVYDEQITGKDYFMGLRHNAGEKNKNLYHSIPFVSHMLEIVYNMPPDLEGKEVLVTSTPYGNVNGNLPETYKVTLSNSDGNQKFIPVIFPKKDLISKDNHLEPSKVFTKFDKDGKIARDEGVYYQVRDLVKEDDLPNSIDEKYMEGTLGWGIFKQVVLEDSRGKPMKLLLFQGYAFDPNFKANVDFRNLPPKVKELYPGLTLRS